MPLPPVDAAELYRDKNLSACEIAALRGGKKAGVEAILKKAGLGGVHWCPLCRRLETL